MDTYEDVFMVEIDFVFLSSSNSELEALASSGFRNQSRQLSLHEVYPGAFAS